VNYNLISLFNYNINKKKGAGAPFSFAIQAHSFAARDKYFLPVA
jgi:hypothetical protein